MSRIDVFLVHGIAEKIGENYYDDFVMGIRKHLPIAADVSFHPIDYSHLLADKEQEIFSWMKDMGYTKVRKFACDFICDALAYGYPKQSPDVGDFIFDLHELLRRKYRMVCDVYPDSKKVIIGHSLGSLVAYGFTFEEHFDALITMGSPFCYFSIRYKNFGENNPNLKQFWNFWKQYDVISTKIAKNPNFKSVKDVQVTSWNPKDCVPRLAHSAYWNSEQVHKKVGEILKGLKE